MLSTDKWWWKTRLWRFSCRVCMDYQKRSLHTPASQLSWNVTDLLTEVRVAAGQLLHTVIKRWWFLCIKHTGTVVIQASFEWVISHNSLLPFLLWSLMYEILESKLCKYSPVAIKNNAWRCFAILYNLFHHHKSCPQTVERISFKNSL